MVLNVSSWTQFIPKPTLAGVTAKINNSTTNAPPSGFATRARDYTAFNVISEIDNNNNGINATERNIDITQLLQTYAEIGDGWQALPHTHKYVRICQFQCVRVAVAHTVPGDLLPASLQRRMHEAQNLGNATADRATVIKVFDDKNTDMAFFMSGRKRKKRSVNMLFL